MGNLAEMKASSSQVSLVKMLLMGDTKAGKTDWAMRAAEAGFNVIYLDGDVAIQTLLGKTRGLSPAALKRVSYFNISDYVDDKGEYIPFMAKFFVELTTQGVFTWNDTKGRVFDRRDYRVDYETNTGDEPSKPIGGDEVWQLRPARFDKNTVVIMDSWTTLVTSLQMWKAGDLGIDILEIEKLERDMYTGTAHKATQFLQLLRALPCHLIVIGHPREYQKKSPPPGSKGQVAEKDMRLDWVKMVPHSTSNPHALTMGKNFSDIAWIDVSATGTRTIDMRTKPDRVIGGHIDEKFNVDEFSFADLVDRIGGTFTPDAPTDSWLTRYGPGEFQIAGKATNPLTGSNAATAKPVSVKTGGLAALMKPK